MVIHETLPADTSVCNCEEQDNLGDKVNLVLHQMIKILPSMDNMHSTWWNFLISGFVDWKANLLSNKATHSALHHINLGKYIIG